MVSKMCLLGDKKKDEGGLEKASARPDFVKEKHKAGAKGRLSNGKVERRGSGHNIGLGQKLHPTPCFSIVNL